MTHDNDIVGSVRPSIHPSVRIRYCIATA